MSANGEANANGLPEALREDAALLAMGALLPEEAREIEARLDAHPGGRRLYESYRQAWSQVREDGRAEGDLDAQRVLKALRRKLAEESRTSLKPVPAPPATTAHGQAIWAGAVLALAAVAVIAAALFFSPQGPPPPGPGPHAPAAPLAHAEPLPGDEDEPLPLRAGESLTAQADGQRLLFASGVDVRLRESSRVRLRDAGLLELEAGEAAVYVPPSVKGFAVRAGKGAAQADGEARFALRLGEPGAVLTVAQGEAVFSGAEGKVGVAAGQGSSLDAEGRPGPPRAADAEQATAWVVERTQKSLALKLRLEPAGPTGVALAYASLENVGEHPVRVIGFHPLGVNYNLERLRGEAKEGSFAKLAPRKLRRRLAPDLAEELSFSRTPVTLEPGQSYELEMDFGAYREEGGPSLRIAVHYLHYESPTGGQQGWGFTLRSNEVLLR
ncbi:MAG: hypothetical protein M5U26_05605 [Planctomycetota bacterium]|nr:hypothetical protein [Planctomycetota bacterium]